jgi:hypothetical protein
MTKRKHLSAEEISAMVDGFDPVDWVQLDLLANMPPERRLIPGLMARNSQWRLYEAHFAISFLNYPCPRSI